MAKTPTPEELKAMADKAKAATNTTSVGSVAGPSVNEVSGGLVTAPAQPSAIESGVQAMNVHENSPSTQMLQGQPVADYPQMGMRPVYNPDASSNVALAKVNPFVQRQMGMAYDRAATMKDPDARANYLAQASSGLGEAQGSFAQRAQNDDARRAGLVQQGSDGRDRTIGSVRPYAGQVLGMTNAEGKNIDAQINNVSDSSQGHVTYGKPSAEMMAKQHLDDLATNKAIRSQDMSIANGTDMSGKQIKDIDDLGQRTIARQPDRVMQQSIANGTYKPGASGTINGLPAEQQNSLTAQDMLRRGILNDGSSAQMINTDINQRIRDGKGFGDLLTKYDRESQNPDFNRSKVTPQYVQGNGNDPRDQYAGSAVDPRSLDVAFGGASPTTPQVSPYALPSARDQEAIVQQRMADNDIKNAPLKAAEATRQAQYDAKEAMERASAPRMTGDPLRDAPIAANIANAAAGMARANGITDEQLKRNPELAARYLPKENGVGALASNASTNELAMQTLRGTSMPSLINRAITQNFGGSVTDDAENKQAIDQISKQATIDQKDDTASASAERLELAKQTAQNALDAKSGAAAALRIKGLEGRLDRADKEILTNTTDLGDIAKKKGAAENLKALEKKRAKIQAALDKESGLQPEETEEAKPTSEAPVAPGSAGPLDAEGAKAILAEAGGDKNKARELAKQRGHTL